MSLNLIAAFKNTCYQTSKSYAVHASLLFYVIKSNSNPHEFRNQLENVCKGENNYNLLATQFDSSFKDFQSTDAGKQYMLNFDSQKSESDDDSGNSGLNSSSESNILTDSSSEFSMPNRKRSFSQSNNSDFKNTSNHNRNKRFKSN